jgi:hypothetical protein
MMDGKLKVYKYQDGIEIAGNRIGLRQLAEICLALSNLAETEVGTPANHYHVADYMNNAEDGSIPLVILLNNEL